MEGGIRKFNSDIVEDAEGSNFLPNVVPSLAGISSEFASYGYLLHGF